MSKDDGKCDCAATGPDECVCGAWDDATRTDREITLAHHAACTCGGAGPCEGCPACEMWHTLYPSNIPPCVSAGKGAA
jgi:hypothetical protein